MEIPGGLIRVPYFSVTHATSEPRACLIGAPVGKLCPLPWAKPAPAVKDFASDLDFALFEGATVTGVPSRKVGLETNSFLSLRELVLGRLRGCLASRIGLRSWADVVANGRTERRVR